MRKTEEPVTHPDFLDLPPRESEIFFHKFFSQKAQKHRDKYKKKLPEGADYESDSEEAINREFDLVLDKREKTTESTKDFWKIKKGYDYEDLRDEPFDDDDDYLSSDEISSGSIEEAEDEIEGDLVTPNEKATKKRKKMKDFADLEEFSEILKNSGFEDDGKTPPKKKRKFKNNKGKSQKQKKRK